MKLLTQSGLLYSAVQAQTVDGHYGAFPEIDWSVQFDEAVSTTIGGAASTDTTIGINPSIRQIETGYDGGKVITGNGYYTGTVTFAWVVKMFGTDACGAGAVNVPSGYVIWTSFKQAAATAANCIAGASWIWTPYYATATDSIQRSSLATDTSEDWKNGYDNTAAFGSVVFYTVVGGVNAMATYGMGRWNISMWAIQKTGTQMTTTQQANYEVVGDGGLKQVLFDNLKTAIVVNGDADVVGLSMVSQNGCATTTKAKYIDYTIASVTTETSAQLVAGYIHSQTGCDQFIMDEMSISGTYFFDRFTDMKFGDKAVKLPLSSMYGEADNAAGFIWYGLGNPRDNDSANTLTAKRAVYNFGAPVQVEPIYKLKDLYDYLLLFSAPETYGASMIVGHWSLVGANHKARVPQSGAVPLPVRQYGQIHNMWLFNNASPASTTLGLWSETDVNHDMCVFTGQHLGKGMVGAVQLSGVTTGEATPSASTTVLNVVGNNLLNDANTGVSYMNNSFIREIRSPAGGVMQFKGLTQSTTNDQYVEVNCRRIEGYWQQTAWSDIANLTLTTGTSGFIVSCMTGISQCVMDNIVDSTTDALMIQAVATKLTAAEVAACQLDPRYLTWRQMTVQMEYTGTVIWYRTDSMWQRSSTVASSSWGPGVTNSAHTTSSLDNSNITAADNGKSYVFALADGSGIQLSHLTGGTSKAIAPTTNTTAGTGANSLTTAETAFTNSFPNRVDDTQNMCSSTNLLLSGLADTSSLATTVTAYSDGYLATITMALDWFQAGAAGGWRGVCMVYYTSQYIQDDTNGAVCMAAVQATTGPADLSGVFLIHIAASTWQPPAATGAVAPASLALTDAKYGIVTAPAATSYLYTGGYYASAAWYQPKYASSYADIARFGKDRYTGSYCMQGSGSTSYFTAPAAGIQLASAVKLAAGAIAMGSALLAM